MNQWISKQNKPHVTSYLSGCSQNELIAIVGTELVLRIVVEVNEAHFFGGFADGTPTVSHERTFCCRVFYTLKLKEPPKSTYSPLLNHGVEERSRSFRRSSASYKGAWYQ